MTKTPRVQPAARGGDTFQDLPSLTVVIPCWNAEKTVTRTIQSVLNQGYPNLAVIVIDDGSTDRSLDIIKTFGTSILWESGSNRGACAARNYGLAQTTSAYVLFLDADDYLEGTVLKGFAEAAQSSADIIYAPAVKEFGSGRRERLTLPETIDPRLVALSWIRGIYVPPGAVFWRREFIDRLGGWKTDAARNQDGELMLRALLSSPRLAYANRGHCVYVHHDSPDRISRRRTHEALRSAFDTLYDTRVKSSEIGWMDVDWARALDEEFHGIALQCFEENERWLGRRAVAEMQTLGVHGRYGSLKSRVAAALIGLEYTGRLKGLWHTIKRRLPF